MRAGPGALRRPGRPHPDRGPVPGAGGPGSIRPRHGVAVPVDADVGWYGRQSGLGAPTERREGKRVVGCGAAPVAAQAPPPPTITIVPSTCWGGATAVVHGEGFLPGDGV